MKIKRMKTLSALLCIFNIIFCFVACVKEGVNCDSYKDSYYYLSDDFKGKIPYKGFDTLTFISNMGDTAILYCQGKNQNFDKESQNQTAADCGEAKHNFYEKIEFNFEGSNSKLNNMKIEFNSKYGRLNINIMNKLCYGNIAYFTNLQTIPRNQFRVKSGFSRSNTTFYLPFQTTMEKKTLKRVLSNITNDEKVADVISKNGNYLGGRKSRRRKSRRRKSRRRKSRIG
jgi:hypothetical protein